MNVENKNFKFFSIAQRSIVFNITQNMNEIIPTYKDRSIIFITENILKGIKTKYYDINEINDNILRNSYNIDNFILRVILAIIMFFMFIWKIYKYTIEKNNFFLKIFGLLNITRFHNIFLYNKLIQYDELIKDFTIKNIFKIKNYETKEFNETRVREFLEQENRENDIENRENEVENRRKLSISNVLSFRNSILKFKDLKEKVKMKKIDRRATYLDHDISMNKSTSLLNEDKIERVNNEFIFNTDNLFKDKRYYYGIIFLIFLIIILFTTYFTNVYMTYLYYNKLNDYHSHYSVFLKKFSILNELIINLEIRLMNNHNDLTNNIFNELKLEYFEYVQKIK